MAASNAERVARILEKLEDDGLVRVEDGNLIVPDRVGPPKRALRLPGVDSLRDLARAPGRRRVIRASLALLVVVVPALGYWRTSGSSGIS